MDFVTHLPCNSQRHDAVWVIVDWLTIVINAGFSSKLYPSIAGCLTTKYSSWIRGLQKSSIVLDLLFPFTSSSSSSGIVCNLSL